MKEKLKVCLLNDSFPPVIDGVANAVINYANIIEERYGSAVVVTPKYPNAEDSYSFRVVRYPSINIAPKIGYRAGYPLDVETMRELEEIPMDIIHCHCPVASAILARILREIKKVPVIFTYHTKFDIAVSESFGMKSMQEIAIKWLVHNIEACDEVWVVSEGAGENLKSLGYKGEYIVMRNGADFPKGSVSAEKINALRKQYELKEDMTLFLFVGRMMWYKGIRLSLDSLKVVKDSGKKFRMFFVGNGLEYDEIKEYVEEAGLQEECIFVGAVQDRELLRTYFSMCDLFLFPSTFDTNGLVVTEAAACETASIVLENSCASEGIIDGHNGFLTKEDVTYMSEKLLWVCTHRKELKEIGVHAMEEVYLSWEDSVRMAQDRYQEVIRQFDAEENKAYEGWDEEIYAFAADAYEKMRGLEELPTEMSMHLMEEWKLQKDHMMQKRLQLKEHMKSIKSNVKNTHWKAEK
ncbi:MAG: glycosyltransferase [Lachnospiraceae bacterium]|nr:glycosyltransferase [Lachnospiraceae bacterium]